MEEHYVKRMKVQPKEVGKNSSRLLSHSFSFGCFFHFFIMT